MQIQERRRSQEALLEKLNLLAAQTATIKVSHASLAPDPCEQLCRSAAR